MNQFDKYLSAEIKRFQSFRSKSLFNGETVISQGFYSKILKHWLGNGFNLEQFIFIDGERLITEPWKELEYLQLKGALNIAKCAITKLFCRNLV